MSSNPELTGPISPEQAAELRTQRIPGEIFGVFNELIAQNLSDNGTAVVYVGQAIARLERKGFAEDSMNIDGYLEVGPIRSSYRDQGWEVEYRLDPDGSGPGSYLFTDPSAIEAVRRYGRELNDRGARS